MTFCCNKCGYVGEKGPLHEHPGNRNGVCNCYATQVTLKDPNQPFQSLAKADLVDRLRGRYPVGPRLPDGEPEFGWREFEVPPIQREAADEIERLRVEVIAAHAAIREREIFAEAKPVCARCGECHLKPGEICDICGAKNEVR